MPKKRLVSSSRHGSQTLRLDLTFASAMNYTIERSGVKTEIDLSRPSRDILRSKI